MENRVKLADKNLQPLSTPLSRILFSRVAYHLQSPKTRVECPPGSNTVKNKGDIPLERLPGAMPDGLAASFVFPA